MARRRCGPRSTAAGKADRISALSDSLLCYILSFLPTKLAVATSILSKRWRPLYRSLLILDFDDQNFPNFLCFSNFVYSVILLRNITLPIQSFRLKCGNSSDFEPCDVNRFVYAAGQRGIENLDLDMSGPVTDHLEIQLPPCILSCRTLVVLKLKKLLIDDLSYVDFPLLKILHLDLITFTRYEYLMKLLSGSRILEDLQTKDLEVFDWALLDWEHFWEGKAESLPNLVRADISNLDIPFNLLYEAEFIRANLEGTYYLDNPKFHNLIHMELIFDFESWHGTWKWLVEVLEHCPKLQNLTIELSKCGDAFYGDDWNDPQIVPECLSSQLRTCSLRKYEGTECELQFVKYIMQSSKVLRTMTIHSTCSIDINVKHQMLIQLSSCPRGSATCKLLFD